MNEAEAIFFIVKIWAAIGAAVALIFLTVGVDRIDEDARGAYAYRPLLIPGIILLWPLVLWRWYVLETGRDFWPNRHKPPREAHFWVAIVFALTIPGIMLLGLSQRQQWPAEFEPQQIEAPQGETQ